MTRIPLKEKKTNSKGYFVFFTMVFFIIIRLPEEQFDISLNIYIYKKKSWRVQRTYQHIRGARACRAACVASSYGQTLISIMSLKAS